MSDDTLMPSEVRKKVLIQHREIELMLAELEDGASRLTEGGDDGNQVKRAAYALRGVLELHMTFEEVHVVPAITQADGFGPERARHLHAEHADQRVYLDELVQLILEARTAAEIRERVSSLAEMLRNDIAQEERDYVNDRLLRDSIIPNDPFGG